MKADILHAAADAAANFLRRAMAIVHTPMIPTRDGGPDFRRRGVVSGGLSSPVLLTGQPAAVSASSQTVSCLCTSSNTHIGIYGLSQLFDASFPLSQVGSLDELRVYFRQQSMCRPPNIGAFGEEDSLLRDLRKIWFSRPIKLQELTQETLAEALNFLPEEERSRKDPELAARTMHHLARIGIKDLKELDAFLEGERNHAIGFLRDNCRQYVDPEDLEGVRDYFSSLHELEAPSNTLRRSVWRSFTRAVEEIDEKLARQVSRDSDRQWALLQRLILERQQAAQKGQATLQAQIEKNHVVRRAPISGDQQKFVIALPDGHTNLTKVDWYYLGLRLEQSAAFKGRLGNPGDIVDVQSGEKRQTIVTVKKGSLLADYLSTLTRKRYAVLDFPLRHGKNFELSHQARDRLWACARLG